MAGDDSSNKMPAGAPGSIAAVPDDAESRARAQRSPAAPVVATSVATMEARLRALHALRVEARLHDDFEPRYVAFVRALRERLHPRGVRDLQTFDIEDGLRVTVDVGDRLGCDIFYGYYEEAFEARLFGRVIQPGATVIDVGANFGYYTLIGARAAGPTGQVYAFEPDAAARDLLMRNVEANGFQERVTVVSSAVGDVDGEVAFHVAEEPAFSGLYDFGRSPVRDIVTLPIRTLDSVADERGIEAIDAIKIDVEGHDAPVLRGARALLGRSPDPLIVLEISAKNLDDARRTALREALADLEAKGYRGRVLDLEAEGHLRTVPAEVAVTLGAVSLLLTRRDSPTDARLTATVAEQAAVLSAPLDVEPLADETRAGEPHARTLFAGLDPALVASALRGKLAFQERADALHEEMSGLRQERIALVEVIERLTHENEEMRTSFERTHALSDEHRSLAERRWGDVQRLRTQVAQLQAQTAEQQARAAEQRAVLERLEAELQVERQAAAAQTRDHELDRERHRAQVSRLKSEIARLQRTPAGLLNRAARTLAGRLGAGRPR